MRYLFYIPFYLLSVGNFTIFGKVLFVAFWEEYAPHLFRGLLWEKFRGSREVAEKKEKNYFDIVFIKFNNNLGQFEAIRNLRLLSN